MKFFADENIDKPIVETLRKSGYTVLYVLEMEPGIADEQVITRANKDEVLKMLLTRFKEKKVAQVEGYNKFGYIRETNNAVIVSRESGKDTHIPFLKIKLAIEAVRKDQQVYNGGPNRLRMHGITHVNSPIWAILHLAELKEILE